MKGFLFLLLLIAGILVKSYGCDFCEIGFCQSSADFEVVVKCEIITSNDTSASLLVLDVLKGAVNADTIWIDGKDTTIVHDSTSCFYDIHHSASEVGMVGEIKVLGLNKIDSIYYEWEKIGHYRRPHGIFMINELNMNNDSVKGTIYEDFCIEPSASVGAISYSEFKSSWMNDTMQCKSLINSIPSRIKNNNNYQINPNPSQGQFQITFKDNINHKIEVFSLNGQTLYTSTSRNCEINLSDQPKGLYFLKIDQFVNKIVIK